MTIASDRDWPVVCAYRETRITGTYECVGNPGHDGNHYLILLVRKPAEGAS